MYISREKAKREGVQNRYQKRIKHKESLPVLKNRDPGKREGIPPPSAGILQR